MNFINEDFFILLSFCILILAIYKPVRRILLETLDKYISTIKNTFNKKEKEKNDNHTLLEDIKFKFLHLKQFQEEKIKNAEEFNLVTINEKKDEIDKIFNANRADYLTKIKLDHQESIKAIYKKYITKSVKIAKIYLLETDFNNLHEEEIIKRSLARIENSKIL